MLKWVKPLKTIAKICIVIAVILVQTNKQTFIADILLLLPYILIFVYYTLYIVGRLLGYLL